MKLQMMALFLCLFTYGSLTTSAQEGSQERPDIGLRDPTSVFIQGTVVNQNGSPLWMVRLSLTPRQTEIGQTAYSSEDGRFSFYSLQPGLYKLTASAPGYTQVTQELDLASGSEFVHLTLHTTGQPTGTTTGPPVIDASIPLKAREHYQQGVVELQRNKPDKSVDHFKAAIKEYPSFEAAYNALGMAYLQMQKPAPAREAFEKALQLNETSPTARLGMGTVYNDEKQFAEAEKHLLKAQELHATEWRVNYELGRTYFGLNKFDQAEKSLRSAREAQPSYANTYLWLANVFIMQNKYAEGLAQMEMFLELAPKSSMAPQVREKVNLLKKELGRS